MCGKFTQRLSIRELSALLNIPRGPDGDADSDLDDVPGQPLKPMHFALVARLDKNGARVLVPMRWGFSALGAATPSKPDHIHARAETIDSKPTFRGAFRERRGIAVVDSFNEGEEVTPRKTIQHTVRRRDGKPFAIAVLWETWEHPREPDLLTFVMATVPANPLIGTITDRMPAVLAPEDWAKWLGEEPATPEELKALLRTVEGDWEMTPEKKTPPPKKPGGQQELF